MIMINVHNSDIRDLFLSILDFNASPEPEPPPTVSGLRVNQGALVQVAIQENSRGDGSIRWVVQSADDATLTATRDVTPSSNSQIDVTTQFG